MDGSRAEVKAFPAEMQSLYEILAFAREEAEKAGFNATLISKIELAVEEALVNIINHGYSKNSANSTANVSPPNGSIDVECSSLVTGGIKITIRDQGVPYNPLNYKNTVNPQAPLEERSLGGYGIFFIRNLMDEVDYAREDSSNVLTLVKYLVKE